ncbi:class F sortase [Streptomyces sp. NPDC048109]|uniref:class F sortase n=1 Tax=unclassified Streptomyces TaxID=2593676 RepID=UPI0033FAEF87
MTRLSHRPGGRRGALTAAATTSPAQTPQTPPRGPELPPSPLTRTTIPSVGLEAAVDQVALEESGTIALPQDLDHAGWYTGSPTPGQKGNAILVGHVDSIDGPGAVKKGDHIEVNRQDGRTTTYEVDAMSIWPQNSFPSQHVYGPTVGSQIILITCADWDDEQKTYVSNLVVTARPPTTTTGLITGLVSTCDHRFRARCRTGGGCRLQQVPQRPQIRCPWPAASRSAHGRCRPGAARTAGEAQVGALRVGGRADLVGNHAGRRTNLSWCSWRAGLR